jgi:hypothetical protein
MSDAAKKFTTAHRKIERSILEHAKGGDREDQMKIFKAIDRLEDMTGKSELRGSPENEGRWEACKSLRAATRAAEESAYAARQAGRNVEIARLKLEHANRAENRDPYLRELAIHGGGTRRH